MAMGIQYAQYIICVQLIGAMNTIPVVEILEDAAGGTVIIDNIFHRLQLLQGTNSKDLYAAIGNPFSPGIANLEIRPDKFGNTLQLAVKNGYRGPDRESLCNTRHLHSVPHAPPCDIILVILHGDRRNPSYAKVSLRVLDINDNAPTFVEGDRFNLAVMEDYDFVDRVIDASSYSANFAKNSKPVHLIPLPAAVDLDLAENGVKFYRLTTMTGGEIDNGLFELLNESDYTRTNQHTQHAHFPFAPMLRITEQLDREKKQEHWFQLLAIDNGTPQLTGTLTLRLSVTDVNDNKPIFRKPTFHQLTSQMLVELNGRSTNREVIRIPETLPVGSEVVTLVADDKDEGQNAALEYRLLGFRGNELDPIGSQWFCLHKKNDSTTLQIAEPLDADIPQSKLWMDNNGEVFGYLVQVKVEAMDSGSPSLSSTVTLLILVENVNDNKPEIAIQFTNPLYFTPSDVFGIGNKSVLGSVQENFMGPSTIAHLTVTDKDIVILASMSRSSITNWDDIYCETNDTRFSLDQLPSMSLLGHTEGSDTVRQSTLSYLYRMTVLQEFDREASEWIFVQVTCVDQVEKDNVRYAFPQGKYPVTLNSLTGNLSFPLKIMDVNDNAPKFSKDVYHFSVIETPGNPMSFYSSSSLEDSWTVIGQVHATDADSGENQLILYNLLTNPYSAFQIDSSKGIISRTGPLDREADERVELSVEARDQGNPSLSSTCTVVVDIMDINDHPPYWVASAAEGFADYHTGRSEDSVFYFSVSEDAEIGQVIGSIKAIDPDGTSHNGLLQTSVNSEEKGMPVKDEAKITYQLETIEDATVYSISRRTGELRLSRKLDRETRAHYEIRAFAIDNPLAERVSKFKRILVGQHWEKMRSIQYTATATIIITVLDVNDNSPQFEAPLAGQEFHIELNSPLMTPGTTLFTAKAHDADSGENATVNYALDGSGYGLFEIDPTTGVCYIREAILPSTIMKLLANGKIPFTEQVNTMSQMSSTKEERADAFQPPAEMRFVSLSLIVVAYDLGTPKRLNSTRVVRVIWNGQSAKDTHSTHLANAMLGGPYISKLLFSSRPSIPERLLIPLVGGAFLLLIAVCAILFGISRHRKKTNSILTRSYAATTQSTTKRLRVREHWSKLACCASTIMDDTNNGRQVERECVKENSEKADQTNNIFIPSKPLVAAKYPPVSKTIQPYLPDCIPTTNLDTPDSGWRSTVGRLLITPPRVHKSDTNGSTSIRGTRHFSRAYSEESLSLIRETEFGYSALRSYPSMAPGTIAKFTPIRDDVDAEAVQISKHGQEILHHIPFDQQNMCIPKPKASRTKPHGATSNASFYSPLSVATTVQLSYPTFQSMCYGQTTMESDRDQYEHFELGPKDVCTNEPQVVGWKSKFIDTYAENSFV